MNKQFSSSQPDSGDNKSKAKRFWKQFGLICFAVALAVITVFIINL